MKGSLIDRRLQYSADIYRIDLTNFQFDGENFSYFPATYNGKTARSQGVELELHATLARKARLISGCKATWWARLFKEEDWRKTERALREGID